jgi:hypothetical protein
MRVQMNLSQCVWTLALLMGACIAGGAIAAAAYPVPQDQDRISQDKDYSKNKKYRQGVSEGRDDRAHNLDHSKKTHFKKDEDQKVYEVGYQRGHQGDQQK